MYDFFLFSGLDLKTVLSFSGLDLIQFCRFQAETLQLYFFFFFFRARSGQWNSSCSNPGQTTRHCPTPSPPFYDCTAWSRTGTNRTARGPSPSTACECRLSDQNQLAYISAFVSYMPGHALDCFSQEMDFRLWKKNQGSFLRREECTGLWGFFLIDFFL